MTRGRYTNGETSAFMEDRELRRKWWRFVPEGLKTFGLMVTAASSCVIAGVFLASFQHLPERVARNEAKIDTVNVRFGKKIDSLSIRVDQINRTLQDQVCLTIAERRRADWRGCFDDRQAMVK